MVNAWYNPNHEKHREWKENFGFTDSDLISDNTDESFKGETKYPSIEVTVGEGSYKETLPEYINPVTGEELGSQEVSINVEAHEGLYYFENKSEYDLWITNTLNDMSAKVEDPAGETTRLPQEILPDLPDWLEDYNK